MDVVHVSAHSMASTAPKVGWSRKATMIYKTVVPGLLMWLEEGGVAIKPIFVPKNDKKVRLMLEADWMVRGV